MNTLNYLKKLANELDRIESLPVDDEGARIIPPGFLDKTYKLLATAAHQEKALSKLIEAAQCAHVDCEMALADDWDRGDDGFNAMKESLASVLRGAGVIPKHHIK